MKWDSIKNLSHLVVIGNTNYEVVAALLALTPAKSTLFAADEHQATTLQQLAANVNNKSTKVTLKHALMAAKTQTLEWYQYNLPQLNAIAPANAALASLFPGVKLQQKAELDATDIASAITALQLSGQQNLLVLNAPEQNLALLQRLAETQQLNYFTNLVIQHTQDVLYNGAATLAQLSDYLAKQGFKLQQSDNTDPDFPVLQFYRDANAEALKQSQQQVKNLTENLQACQQQLAALKQQAEQANTAKVELTKQLEACQQQLAALKQQAEQANSAKAELTKQLEACQQQLAAQKQQAEQANVAKVELTKQLEASQQQLAAQKQQAEQANTAKAELAKQLEASLQQVEKKKTVIEELENNYKKLEEKFLKLELHSNNRIGELKSELANAQKQLEQVNLVESIDALLDAKLKTYAQSKTDELNKAIGNIKNHINYKVDNSAKQLESFIGINNYLENGVKPLNFHGWPISPDIGLYLTGLIDTNNYDVIIEFGSGTSTVLMAKALLSKQRGITQKDLAITGKSSQSTLKISDVKSLDLPARIVSFEHNSKYHAQTLTALKENGVEQFVDLVHAPLVDYQYKDGTEYLYYDCAEKVAELAKVFKGRRANILILVDGPPGATNKHARFPALPILLNNLSSHQFEIVMDDYNRIEEQEIVALWKNIAEKRYLNCEITELKTEKGLAVVKVF